MTSPTSSRSRRRFAAIGLAAALTASACGSSDDATSAAVDDACRAGQRLVDAKQAADDSAKDRQLERLEDVEDVDGSIDLDEVYDLATDADPDAADDLADLFGDGFDCDIDVPDPAASVDPAPDAAPSASDPVPTDAPIPADTEPPATAPVPEPVPTEAPTAEPPATEPQVTESSAPEPSGESEPAPSAAEPTPPGTTLTLGQQAFVPPEALPLIGVTVDSVEAVSADDVAALGLDANQTEGRSFFFVRSTFENVDGGAIGLESYADFVFVSADGSRAGDVITIGFEPCSSGSAPRDFPQGATYEHCDVVFLAAGATVTSVQWDGFGGPFEDNPVSWAV